MLLYKRKTFPHEHEWISAMELELELELELRLEFRWSCEWCVAVAVAVVEEMQTFIAG